MIPMLMRVRVKVKEKKKVSLYIPLILIWILLLAVMILALPFVILATIISWKRGYGRIILVLYPYIFYLFFVMHGLKVDVKDGDTEVYFSIQ